MRQSVTVPSIAGRKVVRSSAPIVMVTAYDTPFARIADEAGVDIILVGDSVGTNVLGYESSRAVDLDQMVHHVGAVARAKPKALIVGDLPWLSYHLSLGDTVRNAAALIRAGAQAVKLEGGRNRVFAIEAILDAEIPVMGHLELTSQPIHTLVGPAAQGNEMEIDSEFLADAEALARVGCFALALRRIPAGLAKRVTESIEIPTIGIRVGPECDGQALILYDLLGLSPDSPPEFVRRYADLFDQSRNAIARFAADVRSDSYYFNLDGEFPHSGSSSSVSIDESRNHGQARYPGLGRFAGLYETDG